MFGIGGGASSRKHDICLGDILVSASYNGKSSVFQYDFGKTIQGQHFITTGFLNQPQRFSEQQSLGSRPSTEGTATQYKMQ